MVTGQLAFLAAIDALSEIHKDDDNRHLEKGKAYLNRTSWFLREIILFNLCFSQDLFLSHANRICKWPSFSDFPTQIEFRCKLHAFRIYPVRILIRACKQRTPSV